MSKKICILEYSNYGKGYLKVTIPAEKKSPSHDIMIELDDYLIEDGVLKNMEAIADRVSHELNLQKFPPIVLLLRCEETHTSMLSLPTMPIWKAKQLFAKEQRIKKPSAEYACKTNFYHHSLGYVFNTYYMPQRVIDAFKKLAKILGTKLLLTEPFGFYLQKQLSLHGNYVYFFLRHKVCTMLLVVNREIVCVYDFAYETEEDVVRQFLLVISKHEFEYERKQIKRYRVAGDEEMTLNALGLIDAEEKEKTTPDAQNPHKTAKPKAETVADAAITDIEIEYDEVQTSDFSHRFTTASEGLKRRYQKIAEKLLSYNGMLCKITEHSAAFHIDKTVYAQIDIKDDRICLYLAAEPVKYANTRYQCAMSKRKGFEGTPCLYRISTAFRQDGAYDLIDELSEKHGLIKKVTGKSERKE